MVLKTILTRPITKTTVNTYRLYMKTAQYLLDIPDDFDLITPWGIQYARHITAGPRRHITIGWECKDYLKVGDVLKITKVDDVTVKLDVARPKPY